MALTIPNIESITNGSNGYDCQAAPDKTDQDAQNACDAGTAYVVSGMQVTQHTGSDMLVSVASGVYVVNGIQHSYAGGTATVSAASSFDRRDIVTINASGTLTVTAGSPCSVTGWTRSSTVLPPVKPAIPANNCLLGEVAVAYNATVVVNIMCVDKTTIMGNWVAGGSSSTTPIIIPGLSGSPDIYGSVAGNGVLNDEFDQDTSGTPAGWTSFNTPTLVNTSDSLSELHLQSPGTTNSIGGIYKAIPGGGSYPMTITMKLTECFLNATNQSPGIGFCLSSVVPGSGGTGQALVYSQSTASPAVPQGQYGTVNMSTYAWSKVASTLAPIPANISYYLQVTIDGTGENLVFNMSIGGRSFLQVETGVSLAASATYISIFANGNGGNAVTDAYIDWIRFK